jgi:S1-C subfamily serine protease
MNESPAPANNIIRRILQRIRGMVPFASGALAVLLALAFYNYFFPSEQLTKRDVDAAISSALASATPPAAYSADVYRIIQPSIVFIQTEKTGKEGKAENFLGTGVIVSAFGDILTSLHVVKGAEKILLTFADGTQAVGIIALEQPENDIAVLQASALPQLFIPATLGNPGAMDVGDEVYVVGNPYGLYSSMSAGVASGFDRIFQAPGSDQRITGVIQFDAAANPGNSGGPLLNRNGHVIGIVIGIVNPTDESFFVGIGFAVPIGTAAGGLGLPPY